MDILNALLLFKWINTTLKENLQWIKSLWTFLMFCFVLLFLAGTSIMVKMVKQAMAQGQPSNQTEIIVAKTPEEKDKLERFDKLDWSMEQQKYDTL